MTRVSPVTKFISCGRDGGCSPFATSSAVPAGTTTVMVCGSLAVSPKNRNVTSLRISPTNRPAIMEMIILLTIKFFMLIALKGSGYHGKYPRDPPGYHTKGAGCHPGRSAGCAQCD